MHDFLSSMTPIIVIVLALVLVFLSWSWRSRNYDYQCEHCGAKFDLSFPTAVTSMHMMGKKYVKCPHCGKWGWAVPMPKEQ